MGDAGEVFWLDMGEPIRILDLANRLRSLAFAAGLPDVEVDFIGLRPGEKQREELTVQGLELLRTAHPAICVARQSPFDAAGDSTQRVEAQNFAPAPGCGRCAR